MRSLGDGSFRIADGLVRIWHLDSLFQHAFKARRRRGSLRLRASRLRRCPEQCRLKSGHGLRHSQCVTRHSKDANYSRLICLRSHSDRLGARPIRRQHIPDHCHSGGRLLRRTIAIGSDLAMKYDMLLPTGQLPLEAESFACNLDLLRRRDQQCVPHFCMRCLVLNLKVHVGSDFHAR